MNEEQTPHPGFEIAGWLKTGGCIFVLVLTVLAMVMMFTSGRNPIRGYSPPETDEYYAAHPQELKAELEENVLPSLSGVEDCRVEGGVVVVELSGQDYAVARSAILQYFDPGLFQFVTP